MTQDILLPVLRQYQHNDCSGLLAGYDKKETEEIVTRLKNSNDEMLGFLCQLERMILHGKVNLGDGMNYELRALTGVYV